MAPAKRPLRMAHVRITLQSLFFLIAVLGVVGVGMTGFIYPYFFCPASPGACAGCPIWVIEHGVLEIVSGGGNGVRMIAYLFGLFLLIGLLVGRSFCGMACPVGTLQDIFSFFRRKVSSVKGLLMLGASSLALLMVGSIWPYLASERGMDLLTYMWAGYAGAMGAFMMGLLGIILVTKKRGFVVSGIMVLFSAALWAVSFYARKRGLEVTPLASVELSGLVVMMFATIGIVGLIMAIVKGPRTILIAGGKVERGLRWIKYGVLVAVPITTFYFDTLAFTDIDPIGGITATVPELFVAPSEWSGNVFFWYKAAFTVGVLVMVAMVDRAWCRYLCPIGAMYAPTNKFAVSDIMFDEDACIHCQKCIEACPMGINPKEDKRDGECVRCLRCIDVCPVNAQRLVAVNPRIWRGDG